MQTVTSTTFNQQASRLKAIASVEPVLITERGQPTHVLLDYATYTRLKSGASATPTLLDWLALPATTAPDGLDGLLRPSREWPHTLDLS